MAASKKTLELDPRLKAIIDEEFAKFDKFLPSPQEKKVYERKRKEFWDNISVRLKEETISDGRTDDATAAGAN